MVTIDQVENAYQPGADQVDDPWDLLTLIRRELPDEFSGWLASIPSSAWPDGRITIRVEDVRAGLLALFVESGTPMTEQALWWIDDVAVLADRYRAVAGTDVIDLRLEHTTHDACWKFHIDHVKVRLVTTYAGRGTELVPQDSREEARRLQRQYEGPLQRMSAGEVAIFRGGAEGVVHRSPPIAGTGENRSVLVLNIPSDISPPLWTP